MSFIIWRLVVHFFHSVKDAKGNNTGIKTKLGEKLIFSHQGHS